MSRLVIQLPDMPPVEHVLKEEFLTIGRMHGNTIALDNASVSLSHAKLTRIDGDYFLKDLNSTNGTMLNGQSIREARLRDGDHVKFGEVTGRYHAEPVPQPAEIGVPLVPSARPQAVPVPQLAQTVATPASPARPQAVPLPLPAQMVASPVPPARPPAVPMQEPIVPGVAPLFTARTPKPKRGLIPILAGVGVGVVIVAGFLLWKFVPRGSNASTIALQPGPPAAPIPAATALSEKPAAASDQVTPEPFSNNDVPSLIQSLKSTDPTERRRAAEALTALGTGAKQAVPALRDALKDSDAGVRAWAALGLIHNRVYDKGTVPILLQSLHQDDPALRKITCLFLALIPYDEAEKPPVVAALNDCVNQDGNTDVRNAAVFALKLIVTETPRVANK